MDIKVKDKIIFIDGIVRSGLGDLYEEEAKEIAKRINEYDKLMNDYCHLARENTRLIELNRELVEHIEGAIKDIENKHYTSAERILKSALEKAKGIER